MCLVMVLMLNVLIAVVSDQWDSAQVQALPLFLRARLDLVAGLDVLLVAGWPSGPSPPSQASLVTQNEKTSEVGAFGGMCLEACKMFWRLGVFWEAWRLFLQSVLEAWGVFVECFGRAF